MWHWDYGNDPERMYQALNRKYPSPGGLPDFGDFYDNDQCPPDNWSHYSILCVKCTDNPVRQQRHILELCPEYGMAPAGMHDRLDPDTEYAAIVLVDPAQYNAQHYATLVNGSNCPQLERANLKRSNLSIALREYYRLKLGPAPLTGFAP
jgi:hypothetical protein